MAYDIFLNIFDSHIWSAHILENLFHSSSCTEPPMTQPSLIEYFFLQYIQLWYFILHCLLLGFTYSDIISKFIFLSIYFDNSWYMGGSKQYLLNKWSLPFFPWEILFN